MVAQVAVMKGMCQEMKAHLVYCHYVPAASALTNHWLSVAVQEVQVVQVGLVAGMASSRDQSMHRE